MGALPNAAFVVSATVAAVLYAAIVAFLYEYSEVKPVQTQQLATAIGYGLVVMAWAGAEVGFIVARMQPRYDAIGSALADEDERESIGDGEGDESTSLSPPSKAQGARGEASPRSGTAGQAILGIKPTHLPALRLAAEFVLIMAYVYLCDRTTLIAKGPKYMDKTAFWCVNGAILVVAAFTLRKDHAPAGGGDLDAPVKPLQRDQTEEWKGWMQIMFVLYHYFNETEIYNAIRMYIAAYVWMTGFGNFSYYYIKKDFTLVRIAQMMWRLNFFVFFVCTTMNNEYMLYYICPMHTFFTWGVFIPLFVLKERNGSFQTLYVKIFVTGVLSYVLYDVQDGALFKAIMQPFNGTLAFHDPLHPENPPMHEWFFRSGLDHLVWVFGMLCACSFPWFDQQLQALEELPARRRAVRRTLLLLVTLVVTWLWYYQYFSLPKKAYNKIHPYTSFIGIAAYLILRNLTPTLRQWHMHFFAWCGKITLETYILQFHIWMKTTGINGSPKSLMIWFKDYYWLNFVVVTIVYVHVSYRVFHITAGLRDVVIPKEGGAALWRRAVFVVGVLGALYLLAGALMPMLPVP